ncbi:hypothetical protein [Bacillus cereus]|uniref:hypothetical protein n=1 Tax=Bacillus cereus TaxID=1396 RepID=UPI001F0ABCE1|nr:hypothetical protein [Bacillus cereus]
MKGILTTAKWKIIDVMLAGHLDATYKEVSSIRREASKPNWEESDSGHLKTGEEFQPVVVGKTTTQKQNYILLELMNL